MARVLIVDDDRAIRRTPEKLIIDEGHQPIIAADGPTAPETLAGADLRLLDLGLRGMDGLEVIEAGRGAEAFFPPIIVVTARDDMSSTVRAIQLGAFDYRSYRAPLACSRTPSPNPTLCTCGYCGRRS